MTASSLLRKIFVALLGGSTILVGLVLLITPGPGLLFCVLGLLILAREFDVFIRHIDWLEKHLLVLIEHTPVRHRKRWREFVKEMKLRAITSKGD